MAKAEHNKFQSTQLFSESILTLDVNQCWEWQKSVDKDGYGVFRPVYGKAMRAHRYAFMIENGTLPEVVRHSCDNRLCCNPSHLIAGDHQANVMDRVARDRSAKGSNNGRARLQESQVLQILADGRKSHEIAADYGVDPSTVRHIKQRTIWGHLETS